jgi:hypothetical protein
VRQVIAGEKWEVSIEPRFQAFYELLGVRQRALANDPSRHHFGDGVKRNPDPTIATQRVPSQFLKRRETFFFLVDEGPQFVQLAFREMQVPEKVISESQTMAANTR